MISTVVLRRFSLLLLLLLQQRTMLVDALIPQQSTFAARTCRTPSVVSSSFIAPVRGTGDPRRHSISLAAANTEPSTETAETLTCGTGFYPQTGPDGGQYCVVDVETIGQQELADCTAQIFADFDTNADGVITLDELHQGLATKFPTTSLNANIVQHVLKYFDASGDGVLQRGEFKITMDELQRQVELSGLAIQNTARKNFGLTKLTLEQYGALQEESARIGQQTMDAATSQIFADFDTNHDGVISLKELRDGLETKFPRNTSMNSNAQIVQQILDHFDASGDGVLQSDEFVVSLTELRKQVERITKDYYAETANNNTPLPVTAPPPPNRFQNFLANMLDDTCQSNDDCHRPEVCCDFLVKKSCCNTGVMNRQLQSELQLIPVPLGKMSPETRI